MKASLAALTFAGAAQAMDLQPPSLMVQLFSQQKNIVGMAEVISKKFDDRKLNKLSQMEPVAGEEPMSSAKIMAESESRAQSRQVARMKTDFTDTLAECTLGAFIVFFALYLLWKHESKQVSIDSLLTMARNDVKEVRDISNPQKENNLKLVYVSGITKNEFALEDPLLGIQIASSAKLTRRVEMYQWRPFLDGKDRFGQDLVAFRKVWSERVIPSSKNPIGYLNPLEMPVQSEVFHSKNTTLGSFVLNTD